MWKTLACGHWICVFTLAAVVIFLSSAASPFVSLPCCTSGNVKDFTPKEEIERCFHQAKRAGCKYSAYLIESTKEKWSCLKEDNQWITNKIKNGQLKCNPVYGKFKTELKALMKQLYNKQLQRN
ncbi:hypothetical protein EXN66_Car019553 [Channa argus]|uniref:Chemokine interleukin-8-like domain-containing protein n=1 Tax=Channa argus TaxID=215402 RepID=A0A6G1QMU0_CHAAH|nr:hypothetical protein EXN66_Car019553 [Channa argus]